MEENQIVIYQTDNGQTAIDVRLENETVWLSANQMSIFLPVMKKQSESISTMFLLRMNCTKRTTRIFCVLLVVVSKNAHTTLITE